MFTFSIQARKDSTKKNQHALRLHITKNRKLKRTNLGQYVQADHWDFEKHLPNGRHPNKNKLLHFITSKLNEANNIALDYEIRGIKPTIDQFLDRFLGNNSGEVLMFFDKVVKEQMALGNKGNSSAYKNCKGVFKNFLNKKFDLEDTTFQRIDYSLLIDFEKYLRTTGNSDGGVNFQMRTLRACYNKAIDYNLAQYNDYPFRRYKLIRPRVRNRSKDLDTIKDFLNYKFDQKYDKVMDIMRFSVLNQAMNFVDICYMNKSNIKKGRLEYYRAKVKNRNVFISVKLLPESIEILKKYNYNFGFCDGVDDHKGYKRALNRTCHYIAQMSNDCKTKLTFYDLRRSYATLGRNDLGIIRDIISQLLGHRTQDVTEVYLDDYDYSVVDEANEKISKYILG